MKKKFGFSLAELLIALAIVSVIAVMATNISKKGIENAYNAFFYTGYKNLYDAIAEVTDEGEKPAGAMHRPPSKQFVEAIADLFDTEAEDYCNDSSSAENRIDIKAANGIVYSFQKFAQTDESEVYNIYMFIPGTRKKSGNNVIVGKTVRLLYAPDLNNGILVPVEILSTDSVLRPRAYNNDGTGLASDETTDTSINLQLRKDLLPCYIEDGKTGHIWYRYGESTPETFTPRTFTTFREAYCKMYGNLTIGSRTFVNCSSPTSITKDSTPTGALYFENPKKVF